MIVGLNEVQRAVMTVAAFFLEIAHTRAFHALVVIVGLNEVQRAAMTAVAAFFHEIAHAGRSKKIDLPSPRA